MDSRYSSRLIILISRIKINYKRKMLIYSQSVVHKLNLDIYRNTNHFCSLNEKKRIETKMMFLVFKYSYDEVRFILLTFKVVFLDD
jgi:hypothetical protein